MIPLLTRDEARAIDLEAVEDLGLPSLVLMENAGAGATRVLCERFGDRLDRVVLVGGTGQNGGDAWVVARHLWNAGHRGIAAVLIGDPARVGGDAAVNLATLRALGVGPTVIEPGDAALPALLADASVVVEGVFGTGLDRPVEGGWAESLRQLDAASAPVLALDVPSGIDSDTGAVLGAAVHAAVTTTFAGHKRGLHQHPGVDHAGEVVRVSIGVPGPEPTNAALFEPEDVAAALDPRAADAHKGMAGHVLVVGGSPGKAGAAGLAGLGALRGGAGLVTVASRALASPADLEALELMGHPLGDSAAHAVAEVRGLANMGACIVGPGLGVDDWGREVATTLARELAVPMVLDADALTAVAGDLAALVDAAAPRVLTPHPGEASRLLGVPTTEVQADRYSAARELASNSGQIAVLKGARTVIASPEGVLWVCRRGTAALGVAGTGDVLSGLVAAQLATLSPLTAAGVGVVLHAVAGELAASSDRGLLASEVAARAPDALELCRELTANRPTTR